MYIALLLISLRKVPETSSYTLYAAFAPVNAGVSALSGARGPGHTLSPLSLTPVLLPSLNDPPI